MYDKPLVTAQAAKKIQFQGCRSIHIRCASVSISKGEEQSLKFRSFEAALEHSFCSSEARFSDLPSFSKCVLKPTRGRYGAIIKDSISLSEIKIE